MTGFEPGSSGIGSDRSANCATTTAHLFEIISKIPLSLDTFYGTPSKVYLYCPARHGMCHQCDQIWRFIGLWETFQRLRPQLICPNLLRKFLGNFYKDVKIFHFSSEIIFGQLIQTFGDFLLVTLCATLNNKQRVQGLPHIYQYQWL